MHPSRRIKGGAGRRNRKRQENRGLIHDFYWILRWPTSSASSICSIVIFIIRQTYAHVKWPVLCPACAPQDRVEHTLPYYYVDFPVVWDPTCTGIESMLFSLPRPPPLAHQICLFPFLSPAAACQAHVWAANGINPAGGEFGKGPVLSPLVY